MLKFNKILFFNFLIIGTLISISSFSWLSMWIGLEMNLLSIIPLMNSSKNSTFSEAMMKYFISQTLASMIFLFSIIFISNLNSFITTINFFILMLNSSLLMKMGAAPFHFWFPQVMEGLSWNLSILMLTWQKIAPFILISYNLQLSLFFFLIITFSSMIGSILGLNQISLRKILTYSSINHLSWMISSMTNSMNLWLNYFIIYSLISLNIIFLFKKLNCFFLKQLILKYSMSKHTKMFLILNFFSLGGLPPFLGFLPKWFTINHLMKFNLWAISIILILCSLITLFFYLRLSISSMMLNHFEQMFLNMKWQNWWIISFNFINLSSLIFVSYFFSLC